MVTLYLEDTYRLRGGGRGGVSISCTTLRGAVFSRAPPHPLVSTTDFTAVASVSLQIIPVYSHLGTHATSVVNSSGSKIVSVTYKCSEPSSDALS